MAKKPASCPTTNACTNATTGECGTTYLVCEDFGGSAYCVGSSGANNCRNTWVTDDTIPTWAGTAISGEGTYSVNMVNSTNTTEFHKVFTAANDLYVFFKLSTGTLNVSKDTPFFRFLDAGWTSFLGMIYLTTDTSIPGSSYWKLTCGSGSAGATSATPGVANNTTYNVWVEYHHVTGANNDQCTVYMSTTGTKGTATMTESDGTQDYQVGITSWRDAYSVTQPLTIDHIRIGTSAFSGVPD
jgi:hypothetical protein